MTSANEEAPAIVVKAAGLTKWFSVKQGMRAALSRAAKEYVRAVDGVDLIIENGDVYGVVGESGCGKTTLGRLLVRLLEPTSGTLEFRGDDISHLKRSKMKPLRREMQIVFQDPFSSLPVRLTAYEILSEPLKIHRMFRSEEELTAKVSSLLEDVGLVPVDLFMKKQPNQLSGGQRQRLSIARALALNPKLIVADEPVSMLDLSVRAGVLNLLRKLKETHGLTMLLITHDLASAQYMCKRIGIMYLGKIVEEGPGKDVLSKPFHPYTMLLKAALPTLDPRIKHHLQPLPTKSEIPSAVDIPSGCRFRTRCVYCRDICTTDEPQLREVDGRKVACHGVGNWVQP